MLKILGGSQTACDGISRRQVLQAGGAGLLGVTLPKVLAAEDRLAGSADARARSVIFILLYGGPAQHETFDCKPEAPAKIRGPFLPIASRTPELRICEHLPQLAALSDRFCIVRTMTHNYNDHSTAGHYIQTGHPWHIPIGGGFNATPNDWPAMGSVVEYLGQRAPGGLARDMPNFVHLPARLGHLQTYSTKLDRPGQYAGWLGRGYDPLATDFRKRNNQDDPFARQCTEDELDFRIQGLAEDASLTLDRFARRRSLVEQFDAVRRADDGGKTLEAYDRFERRAFALVSSERVRRALDVRLEPYAVRDRYGHDLFGQSALLARRLVEAGTRFVTIGWDAPNGYGWDSHLNNDEIKSFLLPNLDRGLSALLTELEDRRLLDETLVVCLGEMGRTPQSNAGGGRGHWSMLFPALLAGGGIRGGTVYGTTDKDAAYAADHPTTPEQLAATVFHSLGIAPDLRVNDAQGRPVPLVDGEPLLTLFS